MQRRLAATLAVTFLALASATSAAPAVWKARVEQETAEKLDLWAGACSLYCLISPSVRASSELREGGRFHAAGRAHDFDLETAWVEGKPGYGIGEYLEYTYDTRKNPVGRDTGVDRIYIVNGYRKSRHLFQANARVKRFRLLVDGKPHAYIHLRDTSTMQVVQFKPIPLPQKSRRTLRFEIVDVYPGSQYHDTVVTDLTFDGVGHH